MREILILFIMICFFYIISICLSGGISIISSIAGYFSQGDENELGIFEYANAKIAFYLCKIQHIATMGGFLGADDECHDPDALNLPGGSPCPIGDNKDCKSGHCDCSFPHSSGSTCYCTFSSGDQKFSGGTPCPSGDDDLCQTGHCDCSYPFSSGSTCYCTSSSEDQKLSSGTPCPSDDDNLCQSGHCDCSFPHSSGSTCHCD